VQLFVALASSFCCLSAKSLAKFLAQTKARAGSGFSFERT